MKLQNRFILAGTFIAMVALIRFFTIESYITIYHIERYILLLQLEVHDSYIWSVIIYIATQIGATVTTIPITIFLTFIGGFLFGPFLGALYAVTGATIGGAALFIATRYLLGNRIQRRYKKELEALNEEIEYYGYWYCFILQLLPFTPTFLFNILTGLTRIPLRLFIITAFFGMLPSAYLYASIGTYFNVLRIIKEVRVISTQTAWLFFVLFFLFIFAFIFTHARLSFFFSQRLAKHVGRRR